MPCSWATLTIAGIVKPPNPRGQTMLFTPANRTNQAAGPVTGARPRWVSRAAWPRRVAQAAVHTYLSCRASQKDSLGAGRGARRRADEQAACRSARQASILSRSGPGWWPAPGSILHQDNGADAGEPVAAGTGLAGARLGAMSGVPRAPAAPRLRAIREAWLRPVIEQLEADPDISASRLRRFHRPRRRGRLERPLRRCGPAGRPGRVAGCQAPTWGRPIRDSACR